MNLRVKKLVSALVEVSYVATQLDLVTRKIGYSVTPEFKGQPHSLSHGVEHRARDTKIQKYFKYYFGEINYN